MKLTLPRRAANVAALVCALNFLHVLAAQPFSISSISMPSSGAARVQFSTQANAYYVLYRGLTVTNINVPVAMTPGTGADATLDDTNAPASGSAFYRVREVPYGEALDPLFASPGLVINEIDYDQIGTDTAEFVEILNTFTNRLALDGVALVFINGANNLEYLRVNLTGFLDPGAYLVVGSSNVVVAPAARAIRFATMTDVIQNGSPDGVCLFHTVANALLDALSYEGAVTAAVINGAPGTFNLVEGTALFEGTADSNTVIRSLIRWPNGQDSDDSSFDWRATATPTPGAVNIP